MSAKEFQLLEKVWENFFQTTEYFYQLGTFTFCLSFASTLVAKKLTPALQHLACEKPSRVDFTVCIWDTAEAKQGLPPLDWGRIQLNDYHGIRHEGIYFHYFKYIGALSVIDVDQHKAFYVVRDANALPWWVSGSPLQVIFHIWLLKQSCQLTHAAAVGNDCSAVLLTGKGGSGKSTTTLACLQEGLNYLSEDYCVLEEKNLQVHSIYQSAKWRFPTRQLFPQYEKYIQNPESADQEKALIYYQDFFPHQVKKSLPVRAMLSLSVSEEKFPTIKAQDELSAWKNLFMSTAAQLPFNDPRTLRLLQRVTQKLSCYHLALGRDSKANVQLIREVLT